MKKIAFIFGLFFITFFAQANNSYENKNLVDNSINLQNCKTSLDINYEELLHICHTFISHHYTGNSYVGMNGNTYYEIMTIVTTTCVEF